MIDASELFDVGRDLLQSAAALPAKAAVVVRKSTQSTYATARELCPVDEGELRDSIHVSAHGLTGEVIAGTDHAEYVEDGTSVMAPQPFMTPALHRNEGPMVAGLTRVAGDIL